RSRRDSLRDRSAVRRAGSPVGNRSFSKDAWTQQPSHFSCRAREPDSQRGGVLGVSRTIVVGAGLSGLVHAYKLARMGRDVLVLEASERPGGVVRTEKREGYLVELGPNTVRPTPELWTLARDLDLHGEALLVSSRAPRYIDFGGRLHPLPMSP